MRRSGRHRNHGRRGKAAPRDRTGASSKPREAIPRHIEDVTGERLLTPPPATGNYGRELRGLLSDIGTPKAAPFKPDPFQMDALAALEFEDVLVTAPTG